VKERPILFSAPMVRAILDGSKTQTRRAAKRTAGGHLKEPRGHRRWHVEDPQAVLACPYGQPGDRLWVRETFLVDDNRRIPKTATRKNFEVDYKATSEDSPHWRWRPSIHMPRWASRITLEITGVRVERLQEISDKDAEAEGIEGWNVATGGDDFQDYWRNYAMTKKEEREGVPQFCGDMRASFRSLWESINGADSWAANPWVWCISFKRVA